MKMSSKLCPAKSGITKSPQSASIMGIHDSNKKPAYSETKMDIDFVRPSESTNMSCCRLCAIASGDAVSIFGEEGIRKELAYKINKNLPIMVSQTNKLPLHVCRKCIAQLDATVNFISSCVKAQYKIEKLFQVLDDVKSDHLPTVRSKKEIDVPNSITYSKSKSSSSCGKEVDSPADETQRRRNDGSSTIGFIDISIQTKGNKCMRMSRRTSNRTVETKIGASRSNALRNIPLVDLSDGEDTTGNVEGDTAAKDIKPQDEEVTDIATRATNNGVHSASAYPPQDSSASRAQLKSFCQYCNAGFKWKAELFHHQTSAHPDSVFRCCHCLKVFYECQEAFLKHKEAHRLVFS